MQILAFAWSFQSNMVLINYTTQKDSFAILSFSVLSLTSPWISIKFINHASVLPLFIQNSLLTSNIFLWYILSTRDDRSPITKELCLPLFYQKQRKKCWKNAQVIIKSNSIGSCLSDPYFHEMAKLVFYKLKTTRQFETK